jgi:hypothetical protein
MRHNRINGCMEGSLNGRPLPPKSRGMVAFFSLRCRGAADRRFLDVHRFVDLLSFI